LPDEQEPRRTDRVTEAARKARALEHFHELRLAADELVEQRGIVYADRLRCGATFPTREEFLVAAPAVVETKARYGLDWFERQWDEPQGSLFD
jgi:hypothetical protein